MRVVADTNVVISMLLWGKSLERLFVKVNKRKVVLCFSPATIDELFRVIHYPKLFKQSAKSKVPIEALVDKLLAASVICHPQTKITKVLEDESDNRILETAVTAEASCIISGDRHLLNLKNYKNIAIYSPAEFLRVAIKVHK
jgi:putative PIN family toxin of toxin-antitoxin system